LRHLARDPRCVLVIFETVRPFRGVEVRGGRPSWSRATSPRRERPSRGAIGVADGERFAAKRRSRPGVLLRLTPDRPRAWDLSRILPA
jgi:hypothetical protein